MGKKFGERLEDFLWGGAEELASEAIGALGIGNGAQVRQQQRLNESAAETNYRWGEKAAQNAYNRQMQMYERSYADQSYSAMVNQLRDAGLSVGLIYGNGGSGGQGGAMTGAPMGDTGGAIAGQANRPMSAAERASAIAQRETLAMNRELAESQANKNNAEAEAARAAAGKDVADTQTANEVRNYLVEGKRQEAISAFFENAKKKFEAEGDWSDIVDNENPWSIDNAVLEMSYVIKESSYYTDMMKLTLDKTAEEINQIMENTKLLEELADESDEKQQLIKAQTALTDKEAFYYWQKLQVEIMDAYSNRLNALSNSQNADTNTRRLGMDIVMNELDATIKSLYAKHDSFKNWVDAFNAVVDQEFKDRMATNAEENLEWQKRKHATDTIVDIMKTLLFLTRFGMR